VLGHGRAHAETHDLPPHHENQHQTVSLKEAKKFARMADHWWDLSGPFKPLHQLNPVRCDFICSALCDNFGLDPTARAPLSGLRILDVGCGGGILSESLARMGANVEGIDVNQEGIDAATRHATLDPELCGLLKYRLTTVEEVAAACGLSSLVHAETLDANLTGGGLILEHKHPQGNIPLYNAVIASEVIEHVASVPAFCEAVIAATAPGGAIIFSTLNRTLRAYALAVLAAEHILKWVPAGTHEWSKFIEPEELAAAVDAAAASSDANVSLQQVAGMLFDPLTGAWRLGRDTGVNYITYFHKKS